jgi:hypothetical protein
LRPHFHETKRNNIAAYKNVFLLFHLTVVRERVLMVGTEWSRDPESYAGSSIASERISHAYTGLKDTLVLQVGVWAWSYNPTS